MTSTEKQALRLVESRFRGRDYLAAAVVFLITLAVYVYTLAPSVTTEDSGELITAAVHFGVPHPPGYPLWSISGFLISHLLPFGNVAWRINLMSALFGASANGVLTLLAAHSGRWLLNQIQPSGTEQLRWVPTFTGMAAGLVLGFSDVMWGQAVIAEVYTLNALFLVSVLLCFYRWMLEPRRMGWLLAAVFVFALGLTNHHTLLFILPAFLLGVYLSRRGLFWSFFVGICAVSLSALLVLAWFSDDPTLQLIAQRLTWIVLAINALVAFYFTRALRWRWLLLGGLMGLLVVQCGEVILGDWFQLQSSTSWGLAGLWVGTAALVANAVLFRRFILSMVLLSWLGLLVYGYMHVASSTNPPMNWGYAREKGGLFHAINRGQYQDSLSTVIKGMVGGVVGLPSAKEENSAEKQLDYIFDILKGVKLYYRSLEDNLSLPLCLLALPIFIYAGQINRAQRRWLTFLIVAYVQLAFFLILISPPGGTDRQSLWATKVFYLQSHCAFVLVIGYGLIATILYSREQAPKLPAWSAAVVVLLGWIPFHQNYHESDQRNHWYGWKFGVDMLKPLEKGAVVFGGTDPGRFVPTYAIFCESTQASRWKRDPEFDRSDLYIITQNALADRYYMKYVRDHYDARSRPKTFSRFERWLGRDRQFPVEPLGIPNDDEFDKYFDEYAGLQQQRMAGQGVEVQGLEGVFFINGLVTRAIFEKNKAKHAFYIEESFPILWTYPYCTPSGLLMKINPEPLEKIPEAAVKESRVFWDRYTASLLAEPEFMEDFAAQKAFAKLRTSQGNLLAYRKLYPEAEYAYQQALQLSPANSETVLRYADVLMRQKKQEEANALVRAALQVDPHDRSFSSFLQNAKVLDAFQKHEAELREAVHKSPEQAEGYAALGKYLAEIQDYEAAERVFLDMAQQRKIGADALVSAAQILLQAQKPEAVLRILESRRKMEPSTARLIYEIAAIQAASQKTDLALKNLNAAVQLGGDKIRDMARQDNRWDLMRGAKQFQQVVPYRP